MLATTLGTRNIDVEVWHSQFFSMPVYSCTKYKCNDYSFVELVFIAENIGLCQNYLVCLIQDVI